MYDLGFFLLIAATILSLYAQTKVSSTFNKYSKMQNAKGYTGADVARMLLELNNIRDVRVEPIQGSLTDHYDPTNKVLRLSEPVYGSTSLAALGVAAHETGHACQHATGYFPLSIRSSLVPIANFGSKFSIFLIVFGLMLSGIAGFFYQVAWAGVIFYVAVVAFQFVTLPVEFNASSRALNMLEDNGYLSQDEVKPAKKVLSAAALTYVAAATVALAQLLRFVGMLNRRR